MAHFQWFKGCEPGNPIRPMTQVIRLYPQNAVLEALTAFRVQLELALGDGVQDDSTGDLWLLLGDILDVFGLTTDERAQVLGPNISALVDAISAQTTYQAIRA